MTKKARDCVLNLNLKEYLSILAKKYRCHSDGATPIFILKEFD